MAMYMTDYLYRLGTAKKVVTYVLSRNCGADAGPAETAEATLEGPITLGPAGRLELEEASGRTLEPAIA